jgi:hypothetical protein
MEKLELKNGEQIEILDGASENTVKVVTTIDTFDALYKKFTDDNLSEISFYNSSDVVCAVYNNKTLKNVTLATETIDEVEVFVATINLKDIDNTQLSINSLQETVDTLVLGSLGVE